MRFVRYQVERQEPRWGWIYEHKVGPIDGNIFGDYSRVPAEMPIESVTLLPPVQPTNIICICRNYVDHDREHGVEVP